MKLTKKTVQAITAIKYIREHGNDDRPVKAKDIAEKEEISIFVLDQIFSSLKKVRAIKAVRGPGGGYVMTSGPLSYKFIMEALGEGIEIVNDTKTDIVGLMNIQRDVTSLFMVETV